MTLLFLLTSSGGPKPVAAVVATVGDLFTAVESRASNTPVAEVNTFAALAAVSEDRLSLQPAGVAGGVGDLAPVAYFSNQNAAALSNAISSLNFLPYDSTVNFVAVVPGVASVAGAPEDRAAAQLAAVVPVQGSSSATATDVLALQATQLVEAVAEISFTLPGRSAASPAADGGGRTALGSVSGGGGRATDGAVADGGGRTATGTVV
jgi:hypothetical protein